MNIYRNRDFMIFLSGFIVAYLALATTEFSRCAFGHGWTASQAFLAIDHPMAAPLLARTDSFRQGPRAGTAQAASGHQDFADRST